MKLTAVAISTTVESTRLQKENAATGVENPDLVFCSSLRIYYIAKSKEW